MIFLVFNLNIEVADHVPHHPCRGNGEWPLCTYKSHLKWHRRCFILFSLWPFCLPQQPWASAASASIGTAPWSLHRAVAAGHHRFHSTDPRGVSEPGLRNWLFPLSLCPRTSPLRRGDIKILFLQALTNAHRPPGMYYHWMEVTVALLPTTWHLSPSPMLAIISFLFPPNFIL